MTIFNTRVCGIRRGILDYAAADPQVFPNVSAIGERFLAELMDLFLLVRKRYLEALNKLDGLEPPKGLASHQRKIQGLPPPFAFDAAQSMMFEPIS